MKWLVLLSILIVSLFVGESSGPQWASSKDIGNALAGDTSLHSQLLIQWRLPRVLAAALVGSLLGLGGTIFQGVFRNPLAEPYLLGSAGGAALGATVALLVPLPIPQGLLLPILAFVGAWSATGLVVGVSRVAGVIDAGRLLLSGVAVAAMLGAARSFAMLSLSDDVVNLQAVMSWTLGGIQTPSWSGLLLLGGLTAGCVAGSLIFARGLDYIGLGESIATSFGIRVSQFVAIAVLAASVIVAIAVAFGGLVAFVGLAAPHIARWTVGTRHASLLPASALVGAIIVTLADALARSILPPSEVPLGLISAIAGGPFFIALLLRTVKP